MPDANAFTRRQFLASSLAVVSTLTTAPGFLFRSTRALAETGKASNTPGVPDGRVLVIVQLSGGNDGLNTVVPFGDPAYHKARPEIGIAEKDALALESPAGIGLHPALRGIHELIQQDMGCVVQGVGYPNPNRSHFASMDVWHAGDTRNQTGGTARGWIGKALDHAPVEGIDATLACVCTGGEAPAATRGDQVQPIAFDRADLLRWSPGRHDDALAKAYEALQESPELDDASDPRAFVFRTACDAQVASDRLRKAVGQKSKTKFPRGPLANQLASVAKMIRAELPTRVYYTALGGFDTHAGQANRHQRQLEYFGEAVRAFYKELEATGDADRVVTLAFSEFGRRVKQNASDGTDHGTAGPAFVFGKHVTPGLIGEHPSLTDLDQGDLKHRVDFRSLYADLLGQWMKLDPTTALGKAFPTAGILQRGV